MKIMEKICLITGANSGIGLETAAKMSAMNFRVVLAVRDIAKGKNAADHIAKATGNTNLEVIPLDLSSLKSIRGASEEIKAKYGRLDVLVNNAGIYRTIYGKTEDGFEAVYAVNYLGHFLLTNLLLDLLRLTAQQNKDVRIINISSYGYKNSQGLNFKEPLVDSDHFDSNRAYGDSKLSLIYFTMELNRRFHKEGITSFALNPGTVRTNLVRPENVGRSYYSVIGRLMKLPGFTVSAKQAAESVAFLAAVPESISKNIEYWDRKKPGKAKLPPDSSECAQKLWDTSEKYAGLK